MTDRPPPSRLPAPDSSGPAGTATANNDHAPHQDEGEDAADRLNPHVVAAVVDIFVYVVVQNLFVEYLPGVLSETFTLSLVTAVLLKGVLEIVVAVKNRVRAGNPHLDGLMTARPAPGSVRNKLSREGGHDAARSESVLLSAACVHHRRVRT